MKYIWGLIFISLMGILFVAMMPTECTKQIKIANMIVAGCMK